MRLCQCHILLINEVAIKQKTKFVRDKIKTGNLKSISINKFEQFIIQFDVISLYLSQARSYINC